MKRGAMPSWSKIVKAMPPLPEPSSLVMIRPSSGLALWNSLAWLSALEPVEASTKISVRCGELAFYFGSCEYVPVPRKIRQLISDLQQEGFSDRGGKGSHRNFCKGNVTVTISGNSGDDAKR